MAPLDNYTNKANSRIISYHPGDWITSDSDDESGPVLEIDSDSGSYSEIGSEPYSENDSEIDNETTGYPSDAETVIFDPSEDRRITIRRNMYLGIHMVESAVVDTVKREIESAVLSFFGINWPVVTHYQQLSADLVPKLVIASRDPREWNTYPNGNVYTMDEGDLLHDYFLRMANKLGARLIYRHFDDNETVQNNV